MSGHIIRTPVVQNQCNLRPSAWCIPVVIPLWLPRSSFMTNLTILTRLSWRSLSQKRPLAASRWQHWWQLTVPSTGKLQLQLMIQLITRVWWSETPSTDVQLPKYGVEPVNIWQAINCKEVSPNYGFILWYALRYCRTSTDIELQKLYCCIIRPPNKRYLDVVIYLIFCIIFSLVLYYPKVVC